MPNDNGVVSLRSLRPVESSMAALECAVKEAGIRIVAKVDHSLAAQAVGMSLLPTQLLIFGNPLSGTALMVVAPTVAIDLPLRCLVWQDTEGIVWLSYNAPSYLGRRHQIPSDLVKLIEGIEALVERVASLSSSS